MAGGPPFQEWPHPPPPPRFFFLRQYAGINDRLIPASGDLASEFEFPTLAASHPVNQAQVTLRTEMVSTLDYFIDNYNRGFCSAYETAAANAKAVTGQAWPECKAASVARLTEPVGFLQSTFS